tara:strand:+ start:11679 stop:12614 length:936 start_codon:yes stop_codon:yes gene_type:complete
MLVLMYDLIIIGGGPAGTAAGVYASRKRLKTILVTDVFGGQSVVSEEIQNWIGTVKISGKELAENLKKHLRAYAEDIVDIVESDKVKTVVQTEEVFTVETERGKKYNGKNIFIASGAQRKKLNVPGAEEFENKGLTYCASCDGPLFADMDVAVVGGGNAGFETAAQLLAYTKSVTLLARREEFKADPITVKKILSNPKMKALTNAETVEIKGDKFVNTVTYKNRETGERHDISVKGVFVEIGLVPSTDMVKDLVELDEYRRVVTNPKNQKTSVPGIWAAGDVTDELYHQNNIAAGDAIKAVEDIYQQYAAR